MIPYLKALFMDEGRFLGAMRAGLVVFGAMVNSGDIDIAMLPGWAGYLFMAAGMFARSSTNGKKK